MRRPRVMVVQIDSQAIPHDLVVRDCFFEQRFLNVPRQVGPDVQDGVTEQ